MKYFLPLGLFCLLLGVSCRPEYLKPVLPGRAPLATTQGYENPAIVDRAIQLKGKVYDGEEELLESGFLVGSSPSADLTVPGVLRIRADLQMDSAISTAEYQMCADYTLGSVAGTTKYYRAYGRNSVGTGYGEPLNFTSIGFPTVSTVSPSAITSVGAVVGGDISSDGGAPVTARGIAYGLTSPPTTSNSTTINGTGSGSFSATITSLAPSTRYFARAYAQNLVGTSYGSVVDFTTLNPPVLATVNTTAISNITGTAATTGGNVTSDGGALVSVRGIAYGTTVNPTTSNNATIDGSGTGVFSSSLTSLTPATTYYVRAYATNSVGTAYGNSVSFATITYYLPNVSTLPVTNITGTSSSSGGNVLDDGGIAVLSRGVVFSTNSNPTLSNNLTVDGAGLGLFSSSITGLNPNTNYYVRAYATNNIGTSYGLQASFSTFNLPTITTSPVTSFTSTAATSGGTITSDGGSMITARGVVYGLNPSPTLSDYFTIDGVGAGTFTSNLSPLLPTTTYYLRAYATNIVGTSFGNSNSFTTLGFPIVNTVSVVDIRLNSAQFNGNVTNDGGASVTNRGFVFDNSINPTTSSNLISVGNGLGSYYTTVNSLTPNLTYFVRAFATNSVGTSYGLNLSFNTPPNCPSSVTDTDGNVYAVVEISGQCWMQSNLKTQKYRDGSIINTNLSNGNWQITTSGATASYNNLPTNDLVYGKLYNYFAVNDLRGLCPTGWRIPISSDISFLLSGIGGTVSGGGALKSTLNQPNTGGWMLPNTGATNSSGFTGKPAGIRYLGGSYGEESRTTYFWIWSGITGNSALALTHDYNTANRGTHYQSNYGMSVRCVRD